MKEQPSDYEVGYGKPPKATRWKRGECGNRLRIYRRKPKNTLLSIEELFMSSVKITVNGEHRKVTVFEAILMQLYQLELSGNRRALRTRQAYEAFALRHVERAVETIFVDNDYTRAVSASSPSDDR